MNIAQDVDVVNNSNEKNASATETKTVYINIAFSQLAKDINDNLVTHQFNGKGRKIAQLSQEQESQYIQYFSDKSGKDKLEQPFEITDGNNIDFVVQPATVNDSAASFKWQGIMQNQYDLQQVKGKKSTYQAVTTLAPGTSETDSVTIQIKFKFDGGKYYVSWDPKVIIKTPPP